MILNEKVAYTFDDLWLVPKCSNIRSRDDVKLYVNLFPKISNTRYVVSHPLVASPMDSVCGENMLVTMAETGGCGILHRGCSPIQQSLMLDNAITMFINNNGYDKKAIFGVAVGIDWEKRVDLTLNLLKSFNEKINIFFCLDVAHADNLIYLESLKRLYEKLYEYKIPILAGSIATPNAVKRLVPYCSGIRVGIGCGSACTTRIQTGHGVPLATSLIECYEELQSSGNDDITLWCDGGVKNPGDMVKALACGADGIIMGSYLAATSDSPAEKIYEPTMVSASPYISCWKSAPGKIKEVVYRGMASYDAQSSHCEKNRKPIYVEGETIRIPYKGETKEVIEKTLASIRSGLSYSGALCIADLVDMAELRVSTSNGLLEAHPHAKFLGK